MATEQRSTSASEEELESLRNHFKDLGFQEYPSLNIDCKRNIIKTLDVRSRLQMEMCSKNEKELAAEIPLKISQIMIRHSRAPNDVSATTGYETVSAVFDFGSIDVLFKQRGTCVVAETSTGRRLWIHDHSVYFEESMTFFESLLKKCHYGVEVFTMLRRENATEWAGREERPIERLPNVKSAWIRVWNPDVMKMWLKKMPTSLHYFSSPDAITSDVVETPHFLTALQLSFNDRCDLTDKQLLELHAFDISIESAPLITTHGVNAYLKKWQCGEGVYGFQRLVIKSFGQDGNKPRREDILDGLDIDDHVYGATIKNKARPNECLYFEQRDVMIEVTSNTQKYKFPFSPLNV